MLDMATRKELAALLYEHVETEGDQDVVFLADDEEHFGTTRRWYEALLLCSGTLAC
jgi:hypothetical protein